MEALASLAAASGVALMTSFRERTEATIVTRLQLHASAYKSAPAQVYSELLKADRFGVELVAEDSVSSAYKSRPRLLVS